MIVMFVVVQASESGVHRPPVGGIHGREKEGAYSIVLSGGYEDDLDEGDSFYYTGSGGRDLTGNKRTADQSCDQTLTRMNLSVLFFSHLYNFSHFLIRDFYLCRALALNCAAPINTGDGAEAKDWRKGKPVRVLRKGHADEKSLAKEAAKGASKSAKPSAAPAGPKKGKGKHTSVYAPEIGVR